MRRHNEQGMILTVALLLGAAFSIISLAVIQYSLIHYASVRRSVVGTDAVALAEAGADNFMFRINQDNSYDGTNGTSNGSQTCNNAKVEVTLFNNSVQGKGTYETCVTDGTITNEKIVYSTGRIYIPANSTTPLLKRKIKLVIEGSNPLPYSIQSGPGGLIMSENVLVANAAVAVGGYISMKNNSQIGTLATPVTVQVANYQCPMADPPGSTYAVLCGSGSPISFNNGTNIYGDVHGNGLPASDPHATNPGIVQTSGVPNISLPDPDRATLKSNATGANAAPSMAGFSTCKDMGVSGKTGVHITGDVSLPNNCTSTVYGDVWVDGNFTTGNNVVIQVANILTSQPHLGVDGAAGVLLGSGSLFAANPTSVAFKVVTYWNSTGNLDATNLTGDQLYNSMYIGNDRTNPRCTIDPGNNASAASGTTLYARWTCINISNNGTLGAILGQIIQLKNNGTVAFNGTSSGGSIGYDVRFYEQL